ncbi:hypothetical protein D3C71_1738730 [compost metagenome]
MAAVYQVARVGHQPGVGLAGTESGHQRIQHGRGLQRRHVLGGHQALPNQQLPFTVALQRHPGRRGQRRPIEFADDLAARQRLAQGNQLVDAITDHPGDGNRNTAGKQS